MILGLTGGLGCGKSTVAEFFARAGWLTVSADNLCHCLYDNSTEIIDAVRQRWGGAVFDAQGAIDRRKIAAIVFSADNELNWLTALLHPAIGKAATAIIDSQSGSPAIIEAPLLFEAAWEGMCDKTVAVYADPKVRDERLRRLRGISSSEIAQRLRSQIPDREKLERADYGLINNESIKMLQEQCNLLITELTGVDHD